MPELILRTQLQNGATQTRPLSEVVALPVEAGANYSIVDAETEQTPVGLSFERKDEDLEIQLEGESVVVLDDFYAPDTAATFSADGAGALGDIALTSADLPAVSEAGALDAAELPDVGAPAWLSVPAGATLSNPLTWGTPGVIGAGVVGAAGVGTGVGIAVTDDDDDDDPNPNIVVFDLVDGDSSDHSGQAFSEGRSYTIFVRVPSQGGMTELAASERWSGARNLGEDDLIVLVGTGGDVEGISGPVTRMSTEGSSVYWRGSESGIVSLFGSGYVTRYGITTETGTSQARIAVTETTTATNVLWTTTETSWSENPNGDNTFSEVYLTTMPAGVLTSQGLA